MEPVVTINQEDPYELLFTLEGVDISISNAIRRTILSSISTPVFKTIPHDENNCTIYKNTTRLNNEIIKQRLSCIPIHYLHRVNEQLMDDLIMEVNVENTTNEYRMVTTRDFTIKSRTTGKILSEEETRKVFPPSRIVLETTGKEAYIDFVKLRPKVSDVPGEHIHLTCTFTYANASKDGMFNVVSTCSYGFTKDETRIPAEFEKQREKLEGQGLSPEEVHFQLKNWLLLDSFRITKQDSVDFIVETLGVYSNRYIVYKACKYLIKMLEEADQYLELVQSPTQENHEFNLRVNLGKNYGDYTIGKVIEKLLFKKYFEEEQILEFCGFRKTHPHDEYATIKLVYTEDFGMSQTQLIEAIRRGEDVIINDYQDVVISHINAAIDDSIRILNQIMVYFTSSDEIEDGYTPLSQLDFR